MKTIFPGSVWLVALALALELTTIPARSADAPGLVVPMVGFVTMRSARIQAQWQPEVGTAPVDLQLEYWQEGQPHALSQPERVDEKTGWVAHWQLSGLEPGKHYHYLVSWNAGAAHGNSEVGTFGTDDLWQWRHDPQPLRVLAGSCAYTNEAQFDRPGKPYGQDTVIFQSMARQQPDLTLWMGDNIYFREVDFEDESGMAARYDKWRRLPDMQPLLRTGSHLAIWDDHDYGPNDSNASYNFKDVSLKLFQRYWDNPSYGLPDLPGVFTRADMADVEFFLTDDRWYRDYDHMVSGEKHMFGEAQMSWLRNALMESTATWKVIVSGSQLFNPKDHYEGWNNFPKEQDAFVNWLSAQKLPGVLFLSGDRHFAAMFKRERPGSYPLYELTCSPLTSHPYQDPSRETTDNPMLVQGTVMTQNNFCELDFQGKFHERTLTVQVKDKDGNTAWSRTIKESELK